VLSLCPSTGRLEIEMSRRILLVEPYDVLADLLVDILEHLDYETVVVSSGTIRESDLRETEYHCVLINLDQNSSRWRNKGLRLAEVASKVGLPVVMIPDHATATAIIEANGWLHFQKPFTLANVEHVMRAARRQPDL
jgi:DNA-binding NtrC family response regulator